MVSEFSSPKPYSRIKMPLRERVPWNHILPVLSARSSDPDTWDQINPLPSVPFSLNIVLNFSIRDIKSSSHSCWLKIFPRAEHIVSYGLLRLRLRKIFDREWKCSNSVEKVLRENTPSLSIHAMWNYFESFQHKYSFKSNLLWWSC